MRMRQWLVGSTLVLLCAFGASAQTRVQFGFRDDAFRIDRRATFDPLRSGDTISVYAEDGLAFSFGPAPERLFLADAPGAYAPYLYAGGCSRQPYLSVTAADGAPITALSAAAASGARDVELRWEILRGGVLLESGTRYVDTGATIEIRDPEGFDELRIAAESFTSFPPDGWSTRNCITLDNVIASVRQDSDADGVEDGADLCPASALRVRVDAVGCTQIQSCEAIPMANFRSVLHCITADWRENEPNQWLPRDCRVGANAGSWLCQKDR
jgi:hypothetical protein